MRVKNEISGEKNSKGVQIRASHREDAGNSEGRGDSDVHSTEETEIISFIINLRL